MLGLYQMLPTPPATFSPKRGPPSLSLFLPFPFISISQDLEIHRLRGQAWRAPSLCAWSLLAWDMGNASWGPCKSFLLSALHCPNPRTMGSECTPKLRNRQRERMGHWLLQAPGSLARTPPRLSSSALGRGSEVPTP